MAFRNQNVWNADLFLFFHNLTGVQLIDTDNANQREKLESNLKSELKKLQRFREQIKAWAANNEIKDKSSLTQARADIERRMERFKALEKEAKTKAFSKEGLQAAAARSDPRERARNEMREWLNGVVDLLNEQIEGFEAEIEDLGPAGGGRKKSRIQPRVTHLEESIARHKQHVTRLEQMLRLLDNEEISPDDVEGIKDLVDDYIDRNQESPDEFLEPDDIYSEILDIIANLAEAVVAAPPSHTKNVKDKELQREKEREERERERQKAAAAAAKAQLAALGNTRLAAETDVDDHKKVPPSKIAGTAVSHISTSATSAIANVPPPPPPPPGRPAKDSNSPNAPQGTSGPETPACNQVVGPSGDLDVQATSPFSPNSNQHSPLASENLAHEEAFPALGGNAPADVKKAGLAPHFGQPRSPSNQTSVGPIPQPPPSTGSSEGVGASISQLTSQIAAMGIKDPSPPSWTPQQMLQLLQSTAPRSIPVYGDSTWQFMPLRQRTPSVPIPGSYPAHKLSIFDNPMLFQKLEPETLFYAFYFQPGSHQQYLAARSLKGQGWRYHKGHQAWFQPREKPISSGEDWEKGTFVYFDHQLRTSDSGSAPGAGGAGWCYRLKNDFVLDHKALENELV